MKNVLVIFAVVMMSLVAADMAHAQLLPQDQQSDDGTSATSAQSQAQSQMQSDAQTESLYNQYSNKEEALQKRKEQQREEQEHAQQGQSNFQPTKISDLVKLAPFTDIAVIQRRYLPKTERFELSASGAISTNNAFFNDIGINARLAYYFSDKYGIEGTYQLISSSKRPITQGLVTNQSIETQSLVEPKGYYGVAFKWSPIYGKMAWFQKKIIPFDIYFTPGFGVTQTTNTSGDTTYMLGVGQLFALSKSYGIRWDLNWNFYSTTISTTDTSGVTTNSSTTHSDVFLGVGFSYFFPEATYR